MRISFCFSSLTSSAFLTLMFQHGRQGAEKGRKKKGKQGTQGAVLKEFTFFIDQLLTWSSSGNDGTLEERGGRQRRGKNKREEEGDRKEAEENSGKRKKEM